MDTKTSRAHRFDVWLRSRSLIVLLFVAALAVSSVVTLVGAGYRFDRWFDHTFGWRENEYEKLTALHSDFTVARFEEQLGAPVFQRQSPDHVWTEYLFRGRDYWVQAISRIDSDVVGFYAVTACSRDFKPEFRLPGGEVIALQRSTLASLRSAASGYMYSVGASTRASLIEFTGGSHTVNFKYFAWGFNGACFEGLPIAEGDGTALMDFLGGKRGWVGELPKRTRELGRDIIVNTFAEWGPTEGDLMSGGWPSDMSVGIDQVLIGAADNESAGP